MLKMGDMLGEVVAPILFMVLVGYFVGDYIGSRALSILGALILGFCVSLYNVWKRLKQLERKKDE